MDFQIEKQLTNVRAPKDTRAELVTSSTTGGLRLTEAGANRIGVAPGDFLGIIQAKVNGERMVLVFKGRQEKNEAGEVTKTIGSKLASPTKQLAGNLTTGSAAAYQVLGGNNKTIRHFDIAEAPIEREGVNYFALVFREETEKAERTKAAEGATV